MLNAQKLKPLKKLRNNKEKNAKPREVFLLQTIALPDLDALNSNKESMPVFQRNSEKEICAKSIQDLRVFSMNNAHPH